MLFARHRYHVLRLTMPASTPAEISSFYQQIPLSSDSRSIRVLDVQGLPDKDDQGPIRGTLKSVDLEAHHNFTALSYVCGTPATSSSSQSTAMLKGLFLPDEKTGPLSGTCIALDGCQAGKTGATD